MINLEREEMRLGYWVESYLIVFLQSTIVSLFLYSAITKGRDLPAFEQAIANFQIMPNKFISFTARAFIGGEILIILLTSCGGNLTILGFMLAAMMLLVFSAALASVLFRKISTNCNCFGRSEKPVTKYDLWRNGGFMACAITGWALRKNHVGQVDLQVIEIILIGLSAVFFIMIWSNLGEIIRVLQ